MTETKLHSIGTAEHNQPMGDIVFIHGLGGRHRNTWQAHDDANAYWPTWLAEDIPNANVWSLQYPSESTRWTSAGGADMSLTDRARNILDYLSNKGVGQNPTCLITHSLGGLLAKQILRLGSEFGNEAWTRFAANIIGVVFIASPHSGSNLATLASAVAISRASKLTQDLQADSPHLRDLSTWYSQNARRLRIKTQAYFEVKNIGPSLVVDPTSADPSVEGCIPIPADGDHFTICKPKTKESPIYVGVKLFITSCLQNSSNTAYRTGAESIVRNSVAPQKSMEIELTIDRDFDEYTETDQQHFLRGVKEMLGMKTNLSIKTKRPGSVKLTLDLSSEEARKLLAAADAGALKKYGVAGARKVLAETDIPTGDQFPEERGGRPLIMRGYSKDYMPAAPQLLVALSAGKRNDATSIETNMMIDSGADMTYVPKSVIDSLQAKSGRALNSGTVTAVASSGRREIMRTFFVSLVVVGTPILLEHFEVIAVGSSSGGLGRDFLNNFEVVLRGPTLVVEIR